MFNPLPSCPAPTGISLIPSNTSIPSVLIENSKKPIILTLTNYANFWNHLAAFIAFPIMAYILSVLWRFSIRLLRGLYKLLTSKEFGWKEVFMGNF